MQRCDNRLGCIFVKADINTATGISEFKTLNTILVSPLHKQNTIKHLLKLAFHSTNV